MMISIMKRRWSSHLGPAQYVGHEEGPRNPRHQVLAAGSAWDTTRFRTATTTATTTTTTTTATATTASATTSNGAAIGEYSMAISTEYMHVFRTRRSAGENWSVIIII